MLQKVSCAIVKRFELFGLVNDENREIYLFGSHQLLMLLINLISMIFIGILFHQTAQSQDYMQYMQNTYNYRSNYSGEYIYNVNLNNVYNMLKQLDETSGGTWRINGSRVGFGLGSIQWTFGRTYNLVKIYREVNGQKSEITKAEATKAEGLMISRELNSSNYNYIYNNWKNSQSSAYNAAYKICVSYEVPADKDNQGKQRGNLAENIYKDMMKGL